MLACDLVNFIRLCLSIIYKTKRKNYEKVAPLHIVLLDNVDVADIGFSLWFRQ